MKFSLIEIVDYNEVKNQALSIAQVTGVRFKDNEALEKAIVSTAMVGSYNLDRLFDKYSSLLRELENINIEVEYIGSVKNSKDFSYGVELIFMNTVLEPEEQLIQDSLPYDKKDETREQAIRRILRSNNLNYVETGKA